MKNRLHLDEFYERKLKELTELQITERFYSRKAILDKKFQQPLGQIQAQVHALNEFVNFLDEVRKE